MDGEKSETKHITCGVPQGSILGPLFFIAYMNDIFQASKYLYNILYADDTSILSSGSDLQKLVREMNRELELISEWFKANKLTLNIDKTYYMVFHRGRRKFKNNIELVINDMKIREEKSMKYLGVIIDSKLNWIDHITYIKNKVAKGIGIIRKAQKLLNKKALLNLYHTLIFPYLIYCVEIWGCAKKTHLPRNITSATCLRRLPYIWRHLRQRNSVNKTEAYHIRQYASRFLTTFWYHIF